MRYWQGMLALAVLMVFGAARIGFAALEQTPPQEGPRAAAAAALTVDYPPATASLAPSPTITATATARPAATPTLVPTPTPTQAPVVAKPAPAARRPAGTVPILMYHYIRVNPDPSDKIGFGLSVTPADFAAQMAFLQARGYRTISPSQLGSPEATAGKAVVITFDDGYADAFAEAAPVLARHGFRGTFYIITGLVGAPRYMNWEQLAALAAGGHTIGSHTVSHPDLRAIGETALRTQLRDSRATLEEKLGFPVLDFCYPAGKYNAGVEAAVGAAGYRTAVTTAGGWAAPGDDRLALSRVRVSGGMSLAAFAAALGEIAP